MNFYSDHHFAGVHRLCNLRNTYFRIDINDRIDGRVWIFGLAQSYQSESKGLTGADVRIREGQVNRKTHPNSFSSQRQPRHRRNGSQLMKVLWEGRHRWNFQATLRSKQLGRKFRLE